MQPVRITQQNEPDSNIACAIVEFSNGVSAIGDWLAGCDGCHSFTRTQIESASRRPLTQQIRPITPLRLPSHVLTGIVRARLEDTSGAGDIIREWAGDEHDSIAIFERPHLRIWVEKVGVARLCWTAVVSHEFRRTHTDSLASGVDGCDDGSWSNHTKCHFAAALMSKFDHPLMAAMRKYLIIASEQSLHHR